MPQTAKKFDVTAITYEGLCTPPPALPTQEELFDYEIETLVSGKWAQYADADPFRNHLPDKGLLLFIPPPPEELDLNELMGRIILNGKNGVNHLDRQYLKNIGEYPATASLLADVEDGRARPNTKPMVSRENIQREKRHPYNMWRGIIHVVVFPWVLKHHHLDLVGSRYTVGRIPSLCVGGAGGPALCAGSEDFAHPEWGAPSLGSIIVP